MQTIHNDIINVVITGGTIDKKSNGSDLYLDNTIIPDIIAKSRCTLDLSYTNLMMIDSLYMTNNDRLKILNHCRLCEFDRIVITHGTDTMVDTALYLGIMDIPKTIVLTGAIVPISIDPCDGIFNLGVSLSAVRMLPIGVFVCMNGRLFKPTDVEKQKSSGLFLGNSYI